MNANDQCRCGHERDSHAEIMSGHCVADDCQCDAFVALGATPFHVKPVSAKVRQLTPLEIRRIAKAMTEIDLARQIKLIDGIIHGSVTPQEWFDEAERLLSRRPKQ